MKNKNTESSRTTAVILGSSILQRTQSKEEIALQLAERKSFTEERVQHTALLKAQARLVNAQAAMLEVSVNAMLKPKK